MGNQSGNLLRLLMLRFNITLWVQIFRMRNFRNAYFHYLNLQKFKEFVFRQFFKKPQCFWLNLVSHNTLIGEIFANFTNFVLFHES